MFRKRITVYASEVASLLGYNNFVDKRDAWDIVLKRNFNFSKVENEKERETDIFKKEKVKEVIDTFVEKNQDLIKEKLSKARTVTEKEAVLVDTFNNSNSNDSTTCNVSVSDLVTKARTMHGHETEKKGIDLFFKETSLSGETSKSGDVSCKPKIKYINPMFQLYGVIDGMTSDNVIIEHKARARRLFYQNPSIQIYKYEYIQVQLYMFLYEKEKAYLVETFEDSLNSRLVEYDSEWLEKNIFSKLNTVMENEHFKNEESLYKYFQLPKHEKPNLF